ncbi:MAG: hypothetical protein ABI907_00085 [Ramlibacter sp.]
MKSWRLVLSWQTLGWAAAALAVVAYAVLAHRAASAPAPGLFEAAVFIVPLMAFALLPAWRSPHRGWWLALWLAGWVALWLARDRVAAGTQWVLLLQHVGINGLLCIAFGRTLAPGEKPMVSRFAEIVHGPLSPLLQRYTRAVTWAWVAYFALTAAVSVILFAWAAQATWSAFVNLLSLPLLGGMFAGEYLVRMAVVPRSERSGLFSAVNAWRQHRRNAGKSG